MLIENILQTETVAKPIEPLIKGGNGSYALIAPDGAIIASLYLNSGHLNGPQKILNPSDGSVLCEILFDSGMPDGNAILFYPDGNVAIKATYKNGLLHGPAFLCDSSGYPRIESCFKNGELDGHQIITMNVNDKPLLDANYIDGTPNGIYHWQKSDTEIYNIKFSDGQPVGCLEDQILADIRAIEELLTPHRKHMYFLDPNDFYSLISRSTLEPISEVVS